MTESVPRSVMGRGIEVTMERLDVALPRSCAGCCGSPDTRQLVPHVVPLLGSSLSAPYCAGCARGLRGGLVPFAVVVAAMIVAAVVGWALGGAPISGVPAVLGAAVAAMLVIGAAVLALPLRPRAAVEMRGKRGTRIMLVCANEAWARELAERSRGTMGSPSRYAFFPHALSIGAATLIAPLVALGVWRSAHARVYVDNASSAPVLVWIDGQPVEVVEPSPVYADPTAIWVTHGWHEIGSSAPGASEPDGAVERAHTAFDVLYNPGRTGCYWRLVAEYTRYGGDPSRRPAGDGPVAREQLPEVGHVDHWFEDPPESVKLRGNQSRVTRSAIVRYGYCTELVRRGCSEEALGELLYCVDHADAEAQIVACEQAAERRCAEEASR